MPSPRHQAILHLVRQRPNAVLDLLRAARVDVAASGTLCSAIEIPSELVPSVLPDYQADAAVRVEDPVGKPIAVVIVEVQLHQDPDKPFTWPYYQALARLRYRLPCEVLVITADEVTAKWAHRQVALGARSTFRAIVVGPRELTMDIASNAPDLAFLCALAHGNRDPAVVSDAIEALAKLPRQDEELYFNEIGKGLPLRAAIALWEKLMSTGRERFANVLLDRIKQGFLEQGREEGREEGRERGREEGREEGMRHTIRTVLAAREIPIERRHEHALSSCSDSDVLDSWAKRAAVASNADEVFGTTPD